MGEGIDDGLAEDVLFDAGGGVEGNDGEDFDVVEFGDDAGGGLFGGVSGVGLMAADDNAGKGQVVDAYRVGGEQGVVYRAEVRPGDDDDGQAKLVGKFEYINAFADRNANTADALNDHDIMMFANKAIGVFDAAIVDGAVFNFRGNNGGGGGRVCGVAGPPVDTLRRP